MSSGLQEDMIRSQTLTKLSGGESFDSIKNYKLDFCSAIHITYEGRSGVSIQ